MPQWMRLGKGIFWLSVRPSPQFRIVKSQYFSVLATFLHAKIFSHVPRGVRIVAVSSLSVLLARFDHDFRDEIVQRVEMFPKMHWISNETATGSLGHTLASESTAKLGHSRLNPMLSGRRRISWPSLPHEDDTTQITVQSEFLPECRRRIL